MTYTQIALVGMLIVIVIDLFVLRTRVLQRGVFWISYAIIVPFQLLTNGVFTGAKIVQYDGAVIFGSTTPEVGRPPFIGDGRLAYAPIEDLMFGFCLVVLSLSVWVALGRAGLQRTPKSGPPRAWLRGGLLGMQLPPSTDGTNPGR